MPICVRCMDVLNVGMLCVMYTTRAGRAGATLTLDGVGRKGTGVLYKNGIDL